MKGFASASMTIVIGLFPILLCAVVTEMSMAMSAKLMKDVPALPTLDSVRKLQDKSTLALEVMILAPKMNAVTWTENVLSTHHVSLTPAKYKQNVLLTSVRLITVAAAITFAKVIKIRMWSVPKTGIQSVERMA